MYFVIHHSIGCELLYLNQTFIWRERFWNDWQTQNSVWHNIKLRMCRLMAKEKKGVRTLVMLKVIGKRKDSQDCSRKPNAFLIWATEKEMFALFLGTPDGRIFYFQCAPPWLGIQLRQVGLKQTLLAHFLKNTKLDKQSWIVPIAIFLMIFRAHMNTLWFITRVKISSLNKWSYRSP